MKHKRTITRFPLVHLNDPQLEREVRLGGIPHPRALVAVRLRRGHAKDPDSPSRPSRPRPTRYHRPRARDVRKRRRASPPSSARACSRTPSPTLGVDADAPDRVHENGVPGLDPTRVRPPCARRRDLGRGDAIVSGGRERSEARAPPSGPPPPFRVSPRARSPSRRRAAAPPRRPSPRARTRRPPRGSPARRRGRREERGRARRCKSFARSVTRASAAPASSAPAATDSGTVGSWNARGLATRCERGPRAPPRSRRARRRGPIARGHAARFASRARPARRRPPSPRRPSTRPSRRGRRPTGTARPPAPGARRRSSARRTREGPPTRPTPARLRSGPRRPPPRSSAARRPAAAAAAAAAARTLDLPARRVEFAPCAAIARRPRRADVRVHQVGLEEVQGGAVALRPRNSRVLSKHGRLATGARACRPPRRVAPGVHRGGVRLERGAVVLVPGTRRPYPSATARAGDVDGGVFVERVPPLFLPASFHSRSLRWSVPHVVLRARNATATRVRVGGISRLSIGRAVSSSDVSRRFSKSRPPPCRPRACVEPPRDAGRRATPARPRRRPERPG